MTYQRHIIGKRGEDIAAAYSLCHGYAILARNYRRKCGEIDLILKKDGVVHFVEVKTLSGREGWNGYRPEENIHPQKLRRIFRTIEMYLIETHSDSEWQLDGICILLDDKQRTARIRYIDNLTL